MAEQAPSEGIPPAGDVPEVTEQQGGAGGGDEKAMVLANISVTVFSSDGHYGGQPEYQEFEDVDVNAPVNEVIAQFDDTGLDDEDVHGEDVVRIYISKPGKPGSFVRDPIYIEDFDDTSLAEAGWEETCIIGLMTRQFAMLQDQRCGRGGGDRFGDITEANFEVQTPNRTEPTEFKEATSVAGKHRVLGTMVYDFRKSACSVLPNGVAVIDPQADASAEPEAPVLEEQNDKSMALVVKAGQYVELDLDPDAPDPGVPRQRQAPTRSYTVTMDIKLEELPEGYLALFSPCAKSDAAELCQLDRYGGVGAHAQFGVKEAAVKAGKWTRIVVSVHLGQENGMTTYIHGRKGTIKCADVSSPYFVAKDSGLVLSKEKMRLFFSPEPSRAVGNKPIRLKYVSVKRRYMDLELVKQHAEKDRIFHYWTTEDKDDEEKLGSLFLHGVKGARMGQPYASLLHSTLCVGC